jgi:hypothetical protein
MIMRLGVDLQRDLDFEVGEDHLASLMKQDRA